MAGTTIPDLLQTGWTQNLLADFPGSWTSDAAKLPGGLLYAILNSFAGNLEIINQQLIYALDACRIETATDVELDYCSEDFYGDGLPRKPGETDSSFRARILAGLLVPKVTKQAIYNLLLALTGEPPRLIDPWIAGQTSGYDWSYYDVDSARIPGCYGDAGLKFKVGVQTILPTDNASGAAPVWGYDAGAAYDSYTAVYWILLAANFITEADLYNLLIGAKAAGITIGLQIIPSGLITWSLAQSFAIATNKTSLALVVQQMAGAYVVLMSGNWNSVYSTNNFTPTGYTATFSTPSPSGNMINLAVVPYTVAGSAFIPVTNGVNSITIDISPIAAGPILMATPNWDTTVWVSGTTGTTITLTFGSPAPVGAALSTLYFPLSSSGLLPVPTGLTTQSVISPVTGVPFALPSWNTTVAISQSGPNLTFVFNTPAPSGAYVWWGVVTTGP